MAAVCKVSLYFFVADVSNDTIRWDAGFLHDCSRSM